MTGKVDRDRKLFVSFFFIAFFVITLCFFYLLPGKWRVAFLCLMSCFLCAFLDIRSLFILVAGILYCYLGGIFLDQYHSHMTNEKKQLNRKWLLFLLVGFCVLWITAYKFGTYFCTRFGIHVPGSVLTRLVMPIGFSFYLFQIISYFVDIYRGNAKAERNFWNLAQMAYQLKLLAAGLFIHSAWRKPEGNRAQDSEQYDGISGVWNVAWCGLKLYCLGTDTWLLYFSGSGEKRLE